MLHARTTLTGDYVPELPEVEFGRKVAAAAVLGRRLELCEVADDSIVYEGVAPDDVARALTGARVDAVCRKGKHLWFELDRRPWPLFHFGMTGAFRVPEAVPLALEGSSKTPDVSWPPRFTKIRMRTDDGRELAMTNARRLGRIRLRNEPATEPPVGDLGFDPLTEMPDLRAFRIRLGRRRGVLKALLLDQTFAAGVGNWIADEVLFQAGLDPRRTVDSMDDDEVRQLHRRLKQVVNRAVAVDADSRRFPRNWLFHHRWGKNAEARTSKGDRIDFVTVGGRTTAWVPARQH